MTNSAFGTGEINLACALMALGIPLDSGNPCSIIAHQNGHVYSRYHFEAISFDGAFRTVEMSALWSNIGQVPDNHPLRVICDFVKSAGHGLKLNDWFDHAQSIFEIGHLTNFEDAQRPVSTFPENPESYCLAFMLNRRELLTLHHKATRETLMTKGDSTALIGVNMPRYQKQELINRLNG